MTEYTEFRKYQRCSYSICRVQMSTDRKWWEEINFIDISAGGLGFSSKREFRPNDVIFLKIAVISGFSEFNMNLEGTILRKNQNSGVYTYGVQFININRHHQIQLDEIIKSKAWVMQNHLIYEDGINAPMSLHKFRRSKTKLQMHG